MGFHALVPLRRSGLLLCDGCGVFLRRDGAPSVSTFATATPEEFAPHADHPSELALVARRSGWRAADDHWLCTLCTRGR